MSEEIIDNNTRTVPVQQNLPGAGGILAMGIIAIPFCLGLIGLILSIITLTNSKKAMDKYYMEPELYTESSLKQVKAGRVCAIVSLSLMGFILLLVIMVNAAG
jgi:hypothetical protein